MKSSAEQKPAEAIVVPAQPVLAPSPREILDAIEADAAKNPAEYARGAIVEHGGE